ncbi:hypothetical protein, partial [Klebsiella oxytoca]
AQHRLRETLLHCALCSPGTALNAPCPGYRFITVCGPVARKDAQHRLRETLSRCALLPKLMLQGLRYA